MLENELDFENYIQIDPFNLAEQELTGFSNEDYIYTCLKLKEANLINAATQYYMDEPFPKINISSITWEGHKFLDNIRDDNVWKNTKSVLSKFTSTSISIISDVASQVISNIISKQLNLF